MALHIGIVGLPNVGKSTLFNALTKKSVPAENYPFCTIDPSVGIVSVSDDRLEKLTAFSHSQKTIPAVIEFVDIAGLVAGASKGEGLGNKFLAHIREVDAILHMVRLFPLAAKKGDTEIVHVFGDVNPLRDIEVINLELILADLETVLKRRGNIAREVKKGEKQAILEEGVLERLQTHFEAEKMGYEIEDWNQEEQKLVKQLTLLTTKKMLYGLNKRAGVDNIDTTHPDLFLQTIHHIQKTGTSYVVIDAKIEDDLKDFEGAEREEMKHEFKISHDDGIPTLIQKAYSLLGLMSYFTTGIDETRAWTVPIGSSAPKAASAIHTDFEKKFIRAEVVAFQDLLNSGSYPEARAKGLVRTEGKDYVVKDGDVIEFRI